MHTVRFETTTGFVSICQSGSNCRTKEDRPFSVPQKRTYETQ